MTYTDGGAGTVVPSQVARDCGADIVLACNAIPGPARSNPLPAWMHGALALLPALERNIDYNAWHAYSWRQASHRFMRDADVSFEFAPTDISMLEAGQWMSSRAIVERSKRESPKIIEAVDELKKRWQILGRRRPPAGAGGNRR